MNTPFFLNEMDNDLPTNQVFDALKLHIDHEAFPPKYVAIIQDFAREYLAICKAHSVHFSQDSERLKKYLHFVRENAESPFQFEPYHKAKRTPFDYHAFSIDMVASLVDKEHSMLIGTPLLEEIEARIAANENVILLSNHQSEADPQALAILLRDDYPTLSEQMIFVAGSRVTTDPMAIPFSMGCNLLCIYSKRHIEIPPEKKQEKLTHNQKTMGVLQTLLKKGGTLIYVAPSGGRDRKNKAGDIEVAPFDGDSIALFHLLAKKAKTPTHFYPLALATYSILPPPPSVEKELGERRTMNWCPIYAQFLAEIDMENFPGSDIPERDTRRVARANYIHSLVKKAHDALRNR